MLQEQAPLSDHHSRIYKYGMNDPMETNMLGRSQTDVLATTRSTDCFSYY